MNFSQIDHIAIICSCYDSAIRFYQDILGFSVISETRREDKEDILVRLRVNGTTELELFIKSNAPQRPSWPEARGLRHLAFTVKDINEAVNMLAEKGVVCEEIRFEADGSRFTFFSDPDGLPLEIHERKNYATCK